MISKLFLLCGSLILYLIAVGMVPLYRRYALSRGILDIANHRSSHEGVTPRGGGLVFMLLWAISLVLGWTSGLFATPMLLTLLPGTVLAAVLGYWDDRHHISPKIRLVGQVLAALIFLAALGKIDTLYLFHRGVALHLVAHPWLLWMMLGISIVWSINLFNFMDGIDGLASIETLFVLGVGGFIFWVSGAPTLALLSWMMVVLVAGFLVWNWPKADIFMGDVGSYCLGFLIAAFAIVGDIWYDIPVALWIILYAVFWFDATLTLLRRLYFKQHWATAHRDHAVQRMHQAGFSHAQVLAITTTVNVVLACLTLWGHYYPSKLIWALCLAVGLVTIWYLWVERLYPQKGGVPQ